MSTITTNDTLTILPSELLENFGVSAPGNNSRINSTKTRKLAAESIYCSGDAYVYGSFKTPIKLSKGIQFDDGSPFAPSISFASDQTTGLYKEPTGELGVAVSGTKVADWSAGGLRMAAPISTTTGDLVLDPVGVNIDLRGHQLINVGGITVNVGNPNDVIVNNSAGNLTSEPQLLPRRGGTGLDTSASIGVAKVNAGTWSVGPISSADIGTLSTLTVNTLTTTTITGTNLALNATNTTLSGALVLTSAGGTTSVRSGSGTTTNAVSLDLLTVPTSADTTMNVRLSVAFASTDGSGVYDSISRAVNAAGTLTVDPPTQNISAISDTIGTSVISVLASGTNIVVRVLGVAGKTIKWNARLDLTTVSH